MASPSATTISPAIESLLLDSPLILPPSGGPPNFVNPPNQIAKTAGLVTLQAFLIVVGLCIRFFVGLRVKKALFVEDCKSTTSGKIVSRARRSNLQIEISFSLAL